MIVNYIETCLSGTFMNTDKFKRAKSPTEETNQLNIIPHRPIILRQTYKGSVSREQRRKHSIA